MLFRSGFCLIPVAVTGGIHLDGYADTSDALSSYGDREKKLDILKDPHCGAFAVIRLCSYFALYFALCACVRFTPRVGLIWLLALVLERCLSGYAVAAFPMAKNTGLAHTFATAADRRRVKAALLTMSVCVGGGMACMGGGLLVLAALAALWRYRAVAVKQFGGVTGDLAGWFCSGRSFGCWRRCCFPGGGWDDLHHGAAVQRQANVRAEARRAADGRRAGAGGGGGGP